MCGIFGYIGKNRQAAEIVLAGLKRLEYRGYDSWGVAVIPDAENLTTNATATDQTIRVKKQVGKIGNATVSELPQGTLAFGHTRWATHGSVTQLNSHPHLDCTRKIAVIHNGIIENYESIKLQLIKSGHTFLSETDSEVIAHLIEEKMHTDSLLTFREAVRLTFLEMEGLNALIAMHLDERELIAARNGSPLVLGFGKEENFLASDPSALLPHTKKVYFLEDGEMASITATTIEVCDTQTKSLKIISKQLLRENQSETEKGDYKFFMEKEIFEQPDIITAIATTATHHYNKVAELIQRSEQTYLIGCGTASYACMAGCYLFSKVAHMQSRWAVGSEFSLNTDHLKQSSLVLALSQSGETMDILEPLKKVKSQGATVAALVNVLGSSLYRLADEKILIGAGPEKAVASTKAFTGKLAHLVLLTYAMAGKLDEGKVVVLKAAESMRAVLAQESTQHIASLANHLKHTKDIYILGRGISYPLSLETALKIKEISYIHAEGLAAGELKHGTLALIEKGTPCIVYVPDDKTYTANLSSAMEVKARGGYIIGVSSKSHDVFDAYIEVADAREATIIPNIVVAQLLAYYLTLEKGFNPDMPRNLAKSVTVK